MSERRHRIIEAALELVAAHGLGGVTMSAVAEGAGVARQTLYNHFPDVDSIVVAALVEHYTATLKELNVVFRALDAPSDRLRYLVRQACEAAVHHGAVSMPGLLASPAAESLAAHEVAMRSLLEDELRRGVESGEFRGDLVPADEAFLLAGFLDAVGELVASDPDRVKQIERTAVRALEAGYFASAG